MMKEHRTPNIERSTLNEAHRYPLAYWLDLGCWVLNVGCWMFLTINNWFALSGGEEMKQAKLPTSNIQRSTSKGQNAVWAIHDGEAAGRKYDLDERLLGFASAIIDLSEKLPASRAGSHVAGQILRSGTSPYPNHGEAEAAESRDDFVHKLKVCLKELRETRRSARLIDRKGWAVSDPTLILVLNECDELIRIFFSSIQTAQRNAMLQKRGSQSTARYPSAENV